MEYTPYVHKIFKSFLISAPPFPLLLLILVVLKTVKALYKKWIHSL